MNNATRPVMREATWVFCDRCGCSVDTELIHPDGHHYSDEGDFYCADCWCTRRHEGSANKRNAVSNRVDKLAGAHADLVKAVESIVSGDDWQRMLDTASRFHRYRTNNVFLIMLQKPDAVRVAGFNVWRSLGRQVRKGEHGITILAPCKYRRTEIDPETGEETTYAGIRGFTTTKVFDVTQTEGDELPEVRPTLLEGDDPEGFWDRLADQVMGAGYTLERGDCGGANGRTDPVTRTVRVRDDVSGAQAAKTLAHELAHILLGHADDTLGYVTCRGRCEVEAESVAFLVCQGVGLPTDDYTFAYVAGWTGGKAEIVRATADRVLGASRAILAALETELEAVA